MEMMGIDPLHYPDEPQREAALKAERVALAPVLAFYVGIIFLCLSLLRAGNLIKFCSHAVRSPPTNCLPPSLLFDQYLN